MLLISTLYRPDAEISYNLYYTRHGRPQGGARRGTCPPPLEIRKYGGPHKDNLTCKNEKKIFSKLSEETELRAPHLVNEETDMRGPPIVSKETDLRGPPYIVCEVTYLRGPHIVSDEA